MSTSDTTLQALQHENTLLRERLANLEQERERLHYQARHYQFIVDMLPYFIFWKDRNLDYLGCNQAFAVAGGLVAPAEIIGKNNYQLAWRQSAHLYQADDRAVMETNQAK